MEYCYSGRKKEIWLSPKTKPPIPTENSKTNGQHKNATENIDCTMIADRLRTVSLSNNSHPTGAVKPVYGYPTFSLTRNGKFVMWKMKSSRLSYTEVWSWPYFPIDGRYLRYSYHRNHQNIFYYLVYFKIESEIALKLSVINSVLPSKVFF